MPSSSIVAESNTELWDILGSKQQRVHLYAVFTNQMKISQQVGYDMITGFRHALLTFYLHLLLREKKNMLQLSDAVLDKSQTCVSDRMELNSAGRKISRNCTEKPDVIALIDVECRYVTTLVRNTTVAQLLNVAQHLIGTKWHLRAVATLNILTNKA